MRSQPEEVVAVWSRFFLLLFLLLVPSTSWGVVGSLVESGHSVYCNLGLVDSIRNRKAAVGALMAADFSRIKAHHQKLNQMDNDAFKQYLMKEVGAVAFCHPVSSELIGVLPGKNYLNPITKLASFPSSVDRKITYGIWAYSAMYRSLRRYVLKAEANLSALPEWDQSRYSDELASAKRLLGELKGISPELAARGEAGARLSDWMKDELDRSGGSVSGLAKRSAKALERDNGLLGFDPNGVSRRSYQRPNISANQSVWSNEENSSEIKDQSVGRAVTGSKDESRHNRPLTGALRPTMSAYTLIGKELIVHDLQTVHLLFPSSIGPKNACFERYAPDYPMFARVMTTRIAGPSETIVLSDKEASELLRFFESASSTEGVSGFMVSDTSAVIAPKQQAESSLSRCVSLVEQTASQTAHEKIVPTHDSADVDYEEWLGGKVVAFDADNDIWQSFMALLAGKRIAHAQLGGKSAH